MLAVATLFSLGALLVSREIVELGRQRIIIGGNNHGLDDGRAIRLLMRHREPHDVFLTTHFGLPALWWYGNVSIANETRGRRLMDGAPVFEIGHVWAGAYRCQNERRLVGLSNAVADKSRAAVYLGFGSNTPPGFQQLVLDDLSRLGTQTFYSAIASEGVAAIYDFRLGPSIDREAASTDEKPRSARLDGCVGVRLARRW
jgi:hypothetical protein